MNYYLKNESVSRSCNWCQIQSGISACVMSSEYFRRTSLCLVRLKIFEWIKILRRHIHQIQENWAGRNFITALHVNSRLITHARMQRFNFQIINSLMHSWGYTWPGLTVIYGKMPLGWETLRQMKLGMLMWFRGINFCWFFCIIRIFKMGHLFFYIQVLLSSRLAVCSIWNGLLLLGVR